MRDNKFSAVVLPADGADVPTLVSALFGSAAHAYRPVAPLPPEVVKGCPKPSRIRVAARLGQVGNATNGKDVGVGLDARRLRPCRRPLGVPRNTSPLLWRLQTTPTRPLAGAVQVHARHACDVTLDVLPSPRPVRLEIVGAEVVVPARPETVLEVTAVDVRHAGYAVADGPAAKQTFSSVSGAVTSRLARPRRTAAGLPGPPCAPQSAPQAGRLAVRAMAVLPTPRRRLAQTGADTMVDTASRLLVPSSSTQVARAGRSPTRRLLVLDKRSDLGYNT